MNIILLTSALPITFGAPRQRLCATQRRDLTRLGDVCVITIDCWGTEWAARRKRTVADRFFPHARLSRLRPEEDVLSWPRRLPQGQSLLQIDPTGPDARSGWMNDRRLARIAATLREAAPDVVLVAEDLLWDVAAQTVDRAVPVVALETGLGDWSDTVSVRNTIATQWLSAVHAQARADRDAFVEAARARAEDAAPAEIVPAAAHLRIAQEKSPLFLEKSGRIVVLASGISWLDEITLHQVGTFWDHKVKHNQDSDVRLVLIGFDPKLSVQFPGAEFHLNGARLHTAIGVARCLVVNHVPPWLLPVVRAALSVGTCVVTSPESAYVHDLDSRTGVFVVPPREIGSALAEFAYSPMISGDLARDIAQEAARTDVQDATPWLAGVLARATGRDEIPIAETPSPVPPMRRSPLSAPVEVLYEPVKKMLMVRVNLYGWSHLEDLRLFSGTGEELTRLAPNAHQQAQNRYLIEGGLVTGMDRVGEHLRVEGYCDSELLFSREVAASDFQEIICGITTVTLKDGSASGTFWINSAHLGDRWFVQSGNDVTGAFPAQGRSFGDLGVHLVPFRTPSHAGLNRPHTLTLLHQPPGNGLRIAPPQKVFTAKVHHAPAPGTRPEIAALKDIHAGRRAWIMGNGPSVRHADLARIPQDDIVFCFNRFYLSYGDSPLRETYVVSADTLMIEDFGQEMIDIAHGLPLFCMGRSAVQGLRGDFVQLDPGSSSVPDFSFDPARYVTVGGSSVYVALQMAWHMGLRDIALYGMDYSFSATLVRDPRYPFPVAHNDDNHFIKGYRDAKPWCPPTWRDISAGFLNARLAFEQTGGRIVNTTRGGQLELFERVDFEDRLTAGKP